jgi:hypothetical protein
MATKKKLLDNKVSWDEIANEVDEEIEAERFGKLSPEDRVLSQIAIEILRLERDMTKPGQAVQDSTRIERLAKFIDESNF